MVDRSRVRERLGFGVASTARCGAARGIGAGRGTGTGGGEIPVDGAAAFFVGRCASLLICNDDEAVSLCDWTTLALSTAGTIGGRGLTVGGGLDCVVAMRSK